MSYKFNEVPYKTMLISVKTTFTESMVTKNLSTLMSNTII
jgi:hypothetical protein